MSKEYAFEFSGTREDFLSALNPYAAFHDSKYFYLGDYIVKLVDDKIHFGVARCGHSGGWWLVSDIHSLDGKTEFRGEIQYIETEGIADNRGTFEKIMGGIGEAVLFVLVFPFALIAWIYTLVERLIRKILRRTKPETNEERLLDLMENRLGCVRK